MAEGAYTRLTPDAWRGSRCWDVARELGELVEEQHTSARECAAMYLGYTVSGGCPDLKGGCQPSSSTSLA